MSSNILITWLGRTDLKAAAGEPEAGLGPIGQGVKFNAYDAVYLLSDFPAAESKAYIKWLSSLTGVVINLRPSRLTSPINFGEIYERAVDVLQEVSLPGTQLTYHLSPGTPAMASVWILLAKTTYPAKLIQSSLQSGVQEADIPFDIAAEFIPKYLQHSDEKLTILAQGMPEEGAEFGNIIHRSAVMKRVIAQARRVAIRSIPVLIEGES